MAFPKLGWNCVANRVSSTRLGVGLRRLKGAWGKVPCGALLWKKELCGG